MKCECSWITLSFIILIFYAYSRSNWFTITEIFGFLQSNVFRNEPKVWLERPKFLSLRAQKGRSLASESDIHATYSNKKDFLMFSSMDDDFMKDFINYTSLKINYASKHGYEFLYSRNDLNIEYSIGRPHSFRVYGALNLLNGNKTKNKYESEWTIYLDADAIVAESEMPFDLVIYYVNKWISETSDQSDCHFIAQDGGHLINSGFWMIRNSSWSRQFLQEWKNEIESASDEDYYLWVYDQGPLQNTVLHFAANVTKDSYDDHCWKKTEAISRNFCYNRFLKNLGHPQNKRKIGPICLLPTDRGLPLRMHSHASEIRHRGEFIFHRKNYSGEVLDSLNTHLAFDLNSKKISFTDGFILTGVHKSLYLTENGTRRQFNGWNSFVSRGFDLDMVVPVDNDVLMAIPEGQLLI